MSDAVIRSRTTPPSRTSATPAKRSFKLNHKLAAFGVFVALSAAVFVAVQFTGDPSAAGPKRILALNPSPASAENAPRVSFADATAQGQELQPQDLAPDPSADPNADAGDGQLHVSVVESGNPTPTAPAVRPLSRAPFAGMTESGPHGVLPIVARDGRTAAQAYARPFTADGHPIVAVVIGGLGFNARTSTQAIELPPEITLSFAPYATNLQTWIDSARAHGHEVMLELPMEPFDPDADDTGPQTLLAASAPQQNISRLEQLLSFGAGYFGVTNYQGARFATSTQASQPVVQALKRRGLVFISSGLGQRTALSTEATRAGLANTAADRIIDSRREADAIDEQLLNLEALALQNRSAIGAGFAYPVTMEQVGRWARDIGTRGYQLAPASAVLRARAAAQR
ncbi:MAG: divergent polysaccharide deacetylase family protein [Pseudomonadota bacterium]